MNKINVFWFRRDLRLNDNVGLHYALQAGLPVLPIFIFDSNILDQLHHKQDARVTFIHQSLENINTELAKQGASLLVLHGKPQIIWQDILKNYQDVINAVYTNRDYEPYALERDLAIEALLTEKGIPFRTFKDHVIFEKTDIVKDGGQPYTIFTPYSKKWLQKLYNHLSHHSKDYADAKRLGHFVKKNFKLPTLLSLGFEKTETLIPPPIFSEILVKNYDKTRDFPAIEGTSRLGLHLRFGTLSIRYLLREAILLNSVFVNELIWRDFYIMIMANFPQVVGASFKPKYDNIAWRNDEADFQKWCEGKTGYPLVDAAMRELNATGYMHNRCRMVVASFLTKHLLIDWRWGEAYFAEKLLDFELASNNGGWQWAAGCGTDAAPYFRIFNPDAQQKKFDKDFKYIRKWVTEFGTPYYVRPIVVHEVARERCLAAYKQALVQ